MVLLYGKKEQLAGALRNGNYKAFRNALTDKSLRSNFINAKSNAVDFGSAFNTPKFNLNKVTRLSDSIRLNMKNSIRNVGKSGANALLNNNFDAGANSKKMIRKFKRDLKKFGL